MTLSPNARQEKLNELYEDGKSKGTLTYKEIMDRLMEMDMEPDQLDKVLENLEALGVEVINENEPAPVSAPSGSRQRHAAGTARPNVKMRKGGFAFR